MDKNRIKRLCESILDTSYSGLTIIDFNLIPKHKYIDELNEWVPDSHSIFIELRLSNNNPMYKIIDIENSIEGILGFECCINFY
jgi:hypothetical protein